MPDLFSFSREMQQYFNTLPVNVQDEIMHSNLKLNSLDDLKEWGEKLKKIC